MTQLHAKNLVSKERWRSLVLFTHALSYPLVSWLKLENFDIPVDWHTTISLIHQQFKIPFPKDVNSITTTISWIKNPKQRSSITSHSSISESLNRASLTIQNRYRTSLDSIIIETPEVEVDYYKKYHVALNEVFQLFGYMNEAGYTFVAVILATVLMDFEFLVSKLRDDGLELWIYMIDALEGDGYLELKNKVLLELKEQK